MRSVVWQSLGLLLCAALSALLMLAPAAVSAGQLTQYIDENGLLQSADATPVTDATATLKSGWYVVNGSITRSGTITVSGDAHLILADGSSLTVTGGQYYAGISVSVGNRLTVYGQEQGSGLLAASGGAYAAGIGGVALNPDSGTITIVGGTVTATGGTSGAGIGGGGQGNAGTITITGGTVTATGGDSDGSIESGEGIGGGGLGYGGTTIISGGTVTATGGDSAAGMSGTIYISGGSVKTDSIRGTVMNKPASDGGMNVWLTTITLADGWGLPVGSASVSLLATDTNLAYGTRDMCTDSSGKLYVYLPADTLTTAAQTTAGGVVPAYTTYRGSIQTVSGGSANGTLSEGGPPAQSTVPGGKTSFTASTLGLAPLAITGVGTIDTGVATAELHSGTVTVTGVAEGSTSIAVTYSNGSGETVPVEVVTPQVAGDFVVATTNVSGYSYNPNDGALLFTEPGSYTVSMRDGVAVTTVSKIQASGGTPDDPIVITLNNVNVQNGYCAFDVKNDSNVRLVLMAGTTNTLKSGGEYPGIRCQTGAALTIAGPGAVSAYGAPYAAGIGGGNSRSAGTITITGGTVTATGGDHGAGIGGGTLGSAGTITITGGTVTATGGGDYGAGIGGGMDGSAGTITITGGTVTATGGVWGAGIGGNGLYETAAGTITIVGGTVTATGGYHAAGIGSDYGYVPTITITGGTVTATGGDSAAGIGGGWQHSGGTVVITGGSVNATAGGNGAEPIGHGANATNSGSLKNSLGADVYLTTVTLAEVHEATSILDIVTSAGYEYGLVGVMTDTDGRLYLYLPSGTDTTAAGAGGNVYTGSIVTTSDPLTSAGTLTLSGSRHDELSVATTLTSGYAYGIDGVLKILQPGEYVVTMAAGVTQATTDRIVIDAPASTAANPVRLTLDDVKIIHSGSSAPCALAIQPGSVVNLTLVGENNTLTSGRDHAGLGCPEGATLILAGEGSLTATGGNYGAGIGGGRDQNAGTITIIGGTVAAYTAYGAAGIGGGFSYSGGGCGGGTITITGGRVTASAGSLGMGAGIGGGGNAGGGGTITISGGTITARGGGIGGAGIGGGEQGAGGTVVITGGSVNATAGGNGAERIGHGANATNSGSLKNSGGAGVYLTTVTLVSGGSGAVDALLRSLIATIGYAYGKNDVYTDGDGRLYLYLPADTQTTAARAADAAQPSVIRTYAGSITTRNDHTGAGTLSELDRLEAPTGLAWDGATPGKATWSAVANATWYTVQLYKDGATQGSAVTGVMGPEYDFSAIIGSAGSGDYTFTVVAVGDGITHSNSDPSAESPVYSYSPPSTLYPVTVTVNKDGSSWSSGAPEVTIGLDSGSAVANGSSLPNGTYNIYADGADTGVDVTVSDAAASATLDYYTLTLNAGTGITSVSGAGVYLSGATADIDAVVADGYTWEKWSDGGTDKQRTITIDGTLTLTASATPTPSGFVAVNDITGVPTTATAGTPLVLSGTVVPANATNQTIIWSLEDAGTTGATLVGDMLSTTAEGTVTVRATIVNGATETSDYTKDFQIVVTAASVDKILISVTAPAAITGVANGTAKTAAALGLPSEVTLVTDGGDVPAVVVWDVDGCPYDPGDAGEQTFTVEGTVTLPAGVINPNDVSLDVTISVTVEAAPVTPTYTIMATAGRGGTITPSGVVHVIEGEDQAFIVRPDAGYRIKSLTVDGVSQRPTRTYIFTHVRADHTITATFTRIGTGGGGTGGGGTGGGGSSPATPPTTGGDTPSTPSTPTVPVYRAEVKRNGQMVGTLPVALGQQAGTAFVDAGAGSMDSGSQGLVEGTTVITMPAIPDVDTYVVSLSVADLSTSDVRGRLTFATGSGSITVPSNLLTGGSGMGGSQVQIAIGKAVKDDIGPEVRAAIGERPVISLAVSIDGAQTAWSNPGAPVTVSIPYVPTAADLANPESIVIWYIDGSGTAVCVPSGRYDPAAGVVVFSVTHFSRFAVGFEPVSFADVGDGAAYSKAVRFLAARAITRGVGNGSFAPEARLTRGQFMVMVMNALSIAPDINWTVNFSDAGQTYYTGYLAAAKRLGISAGVGNDLFAPERPVTRQEMFVLLYNALKVTGPLPQGSSGRSLTDLADAWETAPWAREAAAFLVNTGIVGQGGDKLAPREIATRAESAQLLYDCLIVLTLACDCHW